LLVIRVAPLRRKRRGSITPEIRWRHYAGNPVAPLRRKRNGSYMPEIHNFNAADKNSADAAVLLLKTVYPNAFVKYVGLPAPSGQLEVWLARQG